MTSAGARLVCTVLEGDGWQKVAQLGRKSFEMSTEENWPIVFLRRHARGPDGFSVLRAFQREFPYTKVVLMTGHGDAVEAR